VTTTSSPAAGPVVRAAGRVPAPIILAFGSVGIPMAGLGLVGGVYLPRFYAGLGVDLIAIGATMGLVRLIDLTLDPFLALIMIRTRTPIGRYRPWLLMGAPLMMVGYHQLLMPSGRLDTFDLALGPVVVNLYLMLWQLVTGVGMSMIGLGLASWSAVLATNYHERARLMGFTMSMTVCASVLMLLLPVITHGRIVPGRASDMVSLGWLMIGLLPVAVLICTVFTPERGAPVTTRPRFSLSDYWAAISRPAMRRVILADFALTLGPGCTGPIYVYFFMDAKGFTLAETGYLLIFYIGAGAVGALIWGHVSRRLGKHRTIQIACVAYAIFQTILMALPRVWPGHTIVDAIPSMAGMFMAGFCVSAFGLLVRAMVADIVDEVRLETKQDLTSLLFSMVTTTTKIGGAITVTVTFTILKLVGYSGKPGVVNTQHAIWGLEMCYLFAPVVLVWFGGAALFGYKLDAKRHADIRLALEERDSAASLEVLTGPMPELEPS
jgi:GPH family glycoside/pentoside/hexuronide:cation symporter